MVISGTALFGKVYWASFQSKRRRFVFKTGIRYTFLKYPAFILLRALCGQFRLFSNQNDNMPKMPKLLFRSKLKNINMI